ncbi:MAG: tetratricopeptide repeat protein [Lewinellaceae bacterium]|nr:tetratricopeptide repeat protein [Lewinellaceae bacterium]
MKQINKALMIVVVLSMASACTTQKKRSDMSALGELYHNTTAYYNGYFNADELITASILTLEQQHEDNYTKLLPMFEYTAAENPQAVAPDLDEAIKKVSIVVNLHRYSKWTDDCYLLVGKAQYLKQDYESAEETLRYMANEFTPEKMRKREGASKSDKKVSKKKSSKKKSAKKRKKARKGSKSKTSKEKEKARKQYNKAVKKARKKGEKAPPKPEILQSGRDKEEAAPQDEEGKNDKAKTAENKEEPTDDKDGFLKHRPAYQDALLWLARTMIERDNYDAAQFYLAKLEGGTDTYSDIREQLPATQAYYHLHRKEYGAALPLLEKAIDEEKERKQRARYAYIMAQIYQMNGNGQEAYTAFERALDLKPGFEMEFNCKLNMAQNAWASGSGSSEEAVANLEKMLKDEKNKEYKDQIYYSLAQIALKAGNREEGIMNLKQSLKYSTKNVAQKAESYLTLAGLYFESEEYVPAKNYYDSTLMALNPADLRYPEVERKSKALVEIAANIKVIELQDSLLRLGKMSDAEREALALEIKKKQDEARLKELSEKAKATSAPGPGGRRTVSAAGPALQKESSFFAYDDRAVKRGAREFERKWGNRQLEDDWRRSNKRETSGIAEENTEETPVASPTVLTGDEVKKYLGNIPESDADVRLAELKIQEALFKLGSLYRDRLQNLPKAIATLEELDRRFPDNNYELECWYQLYLAYADMGNTAKSQFYADKILDKYQTSKYALVIKNPNYVSELADEEHKLNTYYDQAYSAFSSGRYQEAYQKSVSAKEQFGAGNSLQPKFALLAAMSTGNLQGKDAYVEALREVVARYPNTPEQLRAKEILRLLGESSASLPGGAREEIEQYKIEDDDLHYVLIVFKDQNVDLNAAKVAVSDFNEKYHKLERLRISNIYLGESAEDRLPILVLRRFKDKKEAMKYYDGTKKNSGDYIDSKIAYEVFPITQNNYREVIKEKSVDNYRVFFEANYLE